MKAKVLPASEFHLVIPTQKVQPVLVKLPTSQKSQEATFWVKYSDFLPTLLTYNIFAQSGHSLKATIHLIIPLLAHSQKRAMHTDPQKSVTELK